MTSCGHDKWKFKTGNINNESWFKKKEPEKLNIEVAKGTIQIDIRKSKQLS